MQQPNLKPVLNKRLLTKKEAAAYCSVHPRTVQRWIHSGAVANVAVTRHVRIDRLDLDQFIEKSKDLEVA
jgi:excisionase family DNA binding protein